jgi:hypothetical protein
MSTPETLTELFRSLGLSLTVRPVDDEDGAWACVLARPDGATYEIDSVSFFDVDPETGDEWVVEPTPSRVLSVLAGGEVEDDEDESPADGTDGTGPLPADAAEAAARAFLGDESYELLVLLDEEGVEEPD